jgi:hypothetical protein
MSKVSIGLRGWRFNEESVFDPSGEIKPLDEIPDDERLRLVRLLTLVEEPCDACYLTYGETERHRCRSAEIVYGEPMGEVVLCGPHESDFLYWFRDAGGSEFRGEVDLADEFYSWFDAGGRAPGDYDGIEHVESAPEALPDTPDPQEIHENLQTRIEGERIDLREYGPDSDSNGDQEPLSEDTLESADVDLSQEYPDK